MTDDGRVLHKVPGQHHLLRWHLNIGDIAFFASIPAELDIDEYG